MVNVFRKAKFSIIAACILTIILGIVLIFNPVDATALICRVVGFFLLMVGMFLTGSYFLNISEKVGNSSLLTGLIEAALGIFMLLKPELLMRFMTSIIGIILLVHSFGLFQIAIEFKRLKYGYWWVSLILALITMLLGIIIIVSPFETIAITMIAAGICLVIDGIIGIGVALRAEKTLKYIQENLTDNKITTTGTEK